jgi:hypothetical protein
MAKKLILNRSRAMDSALNRDDNVAPSSSRISAESEANIQLPFRILNESPNNFLNLTRLGENCLSSLKIQAKSKSQ